MMRRTVVVRAGSDAAGAQAETAVVDKPKLRRFEVSPGLPAPFGATLVDGGVNFAVFSSSAVSATLCLLSLSDLHEVSLKLRHGLCFSSHGMEQSPS